MTTKAFTALSLLVALALFVPGGAQPTVAQSQLDPPIASAFIPNDMTALELYSTRSSSAVSVGHAFSVTKLVLPGQARLQRAV